MQHASPGCCEPVGLLTRRARCCCCSSRTSAPRRCCSPPASRCCSWRARACATCSLLVCAAALAFAVLALTSAYRLKRLTGFLHPWDDPFNGGFQLTQSLIAIGRGAWFGVGLGSERAEAVLSARGAHRFRVRRARRGARAGGRDRRARACSWRWSGAPFRFRAWRRRPACSSSPTSRSPSACGSACRRMVNIGVNMGVLPTKGLTLPLLSYGRSSLLVSLAWLGVLLRIHHEVKCTLALRRDAHAGRRALSAAGTTRRARRHHGGRHRRPRLSGARASRRCCASAVSPWSGSACPAAWSRGWCRRTASRSSGCGCAGFAARASAAWLAAPFRVAAAVLAGGARLAPDQAARRARGRRLCERSRRHRRVAAAHAAADPRAERRRRLDQPLAARFATQVLEAFPGSFGAASQARTVGNPVRADIAALPSPAERFAAAQGARACWCSAAARARSA